MNSICAVILSHNSLDTLQQVVEGVRKQSLAPHRVIVVDNGSRNEVTEYLRQACTDWDLVLLPENNGVGFGHNTGWKKAMGDYGTDWIWSLEHDSIPDENCLHTLVEALQLSEFSNIGAVSPVEQRPVYPDKNGQYYLVSATRIKRIRHHQIAPDGAPFLAKGATFNGVLFSTGLIRKAGFLREDFFVGFEDADYSLRIKKAGFRVLKVPRATIHHNLLKGRRRVQFGDAYFFIPNISALRMYYSMRNRLALVRGSSNELREIILTLLSLPLGLFSILLFQQSRLKKIAAKIIAIRDGLSNNLGKKDYWFLKP